jgi:hypothetical protein
VRRRSTEFESVWNPIMQKAYASGAGGGVDPSSQNFAFDTNVSGGNGPKVEELD